MTSQAPTTGDEVVDVPGPFGAAMDAIARERGGWPSEYMVYAVEVIGRGDDPQVMLTGSAASWMPRAKRWKFAGRYVQAVIRLSEYREALSAATAARQQGVGK